MSTPGPLSRKAIRQRIALAIAKGLGAAGWRESSVVYDRLGNDASDGQSAAHLSFAVGVGTSVPHALDRQRVDIGALAATRVNVRFLHRLRGGDQVGDYDDALEAGTALVAAVLAVDKNPGLSVTWVDDQQPGIVGDGSFVRGQHTFQVIHRAALAA